MNEQTQTASSGVVIVYERCRCCGRCETFVGETVTCVECGEPCSCKGCIADADAEGEPDA